MSLKLRADLLAGCELSLTEGVPIPQEYHSRQDREHAKASAEFVNKTVISKV